MKIFTIDNKAIYLRGNSRLENAVIAVNDDGIQLDLPFYISNELGPVFNTIKHYKFGWSDILSQAQDHGFVLISSLHQYELDFTITQTIIETYDTKINPLRFRNNSCLRIALIFTPSKNCTPNDVTVYLWDDGFVKFDNIKLDGVISMQDKLPAVDHIQILAPQTSIAGEPITLSITQPVPGTDIYLESTAGILNRSRLNTGANVLLNTEGLEPGDTIKVKAGYKFWSGDAEAIISLT
jgi:hypothetical protein